jgi:hypothetical protein
MKIYILVLICIVFTFLVPVLATAEVFNVEATGEYVMGDNDTKIEARRMALEHAKRTAAEKAGTYLESTTIIKNNVLSVDEIRSFTSAVLQTNVVSEDVNLLENKTTRFVIKINASVDTSILEGKIFELKNDTKRKGQLAKLQEDNKKLLMQLDNLSQKLNIKSTAELKVLREQRDELFNRIDNNNNSIQITFTKGTLLNLAMKARNDFEEDKVKIDKLMQTVAASINV